jgi:hypothetical protein
MLEYPEDYTCDGQTDIFDFLDPPEGMEEKTNEQNNLDGKTDKGPGRQIFTGGQGLRAI